MKGSAMAVADTIIEVFGTDSFPDYEQRVYEHHQKQAEREIVTTLNRLLTSIPFLQYLKAWCGKCALRFHEYRTISIRLKSGQSYEIRSPVFLKAKPKKKEAGPLDGKKADYAI
jgi:hypothetical protein